MKRDWDQTRHDLGSDEPDTNQSIGHTARQARGKEITPPRGEPTYEEMKPAYHFGCAAHSKYGSEYSEWNDNLEIRLAKDWRAIEPTRKQTWMQDRAAIRDAWNWRHDQAEDWEAADME